ncbi:MAG TPA: glycosyltransferase family 1 protein [Candidatus Sumerlaeota bacterium]|nr:glycosyltransferase family 1 protein [Candidatus Sumerlaeota bacterium]
MTALLRRFTQTPSAAPPADPRLHVALDVRFWSMSGIGTYVRELLAAYARLRLPLVLTLIGPEGLRDRIAPGLEIRRWIHFEPPVYSAASFFRYPALPGVDLLHYPHYNLPLTRARHKLVTFYDLFHLRYGSLPKRRYQDFFLTRLRWSRAHIVVPSEKTGHDLEVAGLRGRRVSCIPLGPGQSPPERPATPPEDLLTLTGAPPRRRWLLTTGIDQPHKNIDFLISALSLYYQRRPDAPPLVWCGLSAEDRDRRARQIPAHMRQHVVLEPFIDAERLESLMAGALALVFPSLDERFGFPPLEAMTRGVPVLCARREPMSTILGNAPLYFEPNESASLWRAIDRLLAPGTVRQELIDRGRHRAAQYSWDLTAWDTARLYYEVAGREVTVEGEETPEPDDAAAVEQPRQA